MAMGRTVSTTQANPLQPVVHLQAQLHWQHRAPERKALNSLCFQYSATPFPTPSPADWQTHFSHVLLLVPSLSCCQK